MTSVSPPAYIQCRFCLRKVDPKQRCTNDLYDFIQDILLVKINPDHVLVCSNCSLMWNMVRQYLNTCLLANTILERDSKSTIPSPWIETGAQKNALPEMANAVKMHYIEMQALVIANRRHSDSANLVKRVTTFKISNDFLHTLQKPPSEAKSAAGKEPVKQKTDDPPGQCESRNNISSKPPTAKPPPAERPVQIDLLDSSDEEEKHAASGTKKPEGTRRNLDKRKVADRTAAPAPVEQQRNIASGNKLTHDDQQRHVSAAKRPKPYKKGSARQSGRDRLLKTT